MTGLAPNSSPQLVFSTAALVTNPCAISRTAQPKGYPQRGLVTPGKESFKIKDPNYRPVAFTAPKVLANPVWADPENITVAKAQRQFAVGMEYDENGRPRNPIGRTGITGRGELGRWGINEAVDCIVFKINPASGALQILLIQRDNCQWALPGGHVDIHEGESAVDALRRELGEEALGGNTNHSLMDHAKVIADRVYVDDPRSTDNAWIVTTAAYVMLDAATVAATKIEAADDAEDARWFDVSDALLDSLYASHGPLVRMALDDMR